MIVKWAIFLKHSALPLSLHSCRFEVCFIRLPAQVKFRRCFLKAPRNQVKTIEQDAPRRHCDALMRCNALIVVCNCNFHEAVTFVYPAGKQI